QRPTLISMFVRHGLLLTGIGIVCGLAGAFAVMRLMSSLLLNVSPVGPVTYAAVTVGVVATAYLACYLPSRRAATVDPVDALRAESAGSQAKCWIVMSCQASRMEQPKSEHRSSGGGPGESSLRTSQSADVLGDLSAP